MLTNKKPAILVVDDEDAVRELVCLFLETSGFTVHKASGGREAINLVCQPDIVVDILLTDIIMPFMNGRELANRICSFKPHIKVIFISAYSAEILTSQNLCPSGSDYIRKPFSKESLVERISRVWALSPKWRELLAKG
jgi:CheY-like chemotaxis protein